MKKKILSLSMILIITLFTFLPYVDVFGTEVGVVSKSANYVKAGEETEYVASGTNLTNYINNKKGIFESTLTNNGFDSEKGNIDYNTLFSIEDGNCFYATIDSIGEAQYAMIGGVLTEQYPVNYRKMKVEYAPANAIVISFDKNGGNGTMDSAYIDANTDYALPANGFTAQYGEMFDRWWIEGIGYKNPGDVINVASNTVVKATWKPIPTVPISAIHIKFDAPRVGETVEKEHHSEYGYEYDVATMFPTADVNEETDKYYVDGGMFIKSYPSMGDDYDDPFYGTFEKGKTYYAEIAIAAEIGYTFGSNNETTVTVNGKTTGFELNEYNGGSPYFLVYVAFTPSEDENFEDYNLTSGDYSVSFRADAGRNFALKMFDVLTLSDEEIEGLLDEELTREKFNAMLAQIKKTVKDYGNLLGIYAIEIEDNQGAYTGETKVKIKLTDEMKKYNSFKLIYLDENNNFKVEEIVDFKIDGDYLVGTLPHLSAYALVGNNVDNSNPNTGDNIMFNIIMLGICSLGLVVSMGYLIYLKKKIS